MGQLIPEVEKVLHVPGNYKKGTMLEMTLIADMELESEHLLNAVSVIVKRLKMHNEIFRNVRLNFVKWNSDSDMTCEILPLSLLPVRTDLFDNAYAKNEKRLEILTEYLKKFHARSKLIIIITDESYIIKDESLLHSSLIPFLGKKLLVYNSSGNVHSPASLR